MRTPAKIPNDNPEQSDTPCPLCGYRPTSGRNAFMHVVGHLTGNYTTGKEQTTAK